MKMKMKMIRQILMVFSIALLASCCPKIVPQKPVITTTTESSETIDTTKTAQAPDTIKKDVKTIVINASAFCDSLKKAQGIKIENKAQGTSHLSSSVELNPNTGDITFICLQEEYLRQRDSVITINKRLETKIHTLEHQDNFIMKCPSHWPAWAHPIALFIIIVFLIAIVLFLFFKGVF